MKMKKKEKKNNGQFDLGRWAKKKGIPKGEPK